MKRIARFLDLKIFLIYCRILVVFLILTFVSSDRSFAALPSPGVSSIDTSFGIANYLPITNSVVNDGDLVSFSRTGYFLSKIPYDPFVVGVVTDNPAVSLQMNATTKTYPVATTGNAFVNVTTLNGNIKKGDPITSSTIPGVGMKATNTGYIIGTSSENYSSSNTKAVKKISFVLNVHYYISRSTFQIGIFDVFNLSALATYEEPIQAFKYFITALIVILSFTFAFFSFARTANKGLEAIGRNPLASRMIQIGILINILIAIAIILVGLFVAYIVIRL